MMSFTSSQHQSTNEIRLEVVPVKDTSGLWRVFVRGSGGYVIDVCGLDRNNLEQLAEAISVALREEDVRHAERTVSRVSE